MKSPRLPILSILTALALWQTGCGGGDTQSRAAKGAPGGGKDGPPPVPVEVQAVEDRQVEVTVAAVGSVEAYEIVQVTARVPGAVEAVRFREGTRVDKDQLLVEIEPERYRLAVLEAQAALEKARAALAEAEAGLARRTGANEKNAGLIAGEEVDSWRTRTLTARAEITAREAALQMAEHNASDASARAPFAGVVQSRDVQTGRYVQPGTLLATLVRRDPLLLKFKVPETDADRLAPGLRALFTVKEGRGEHRATLVHVAESADPTSRMVDVTAEIQSPPESLRPGSFAEIRVPVGGAHGAAVVPQTAVRPSERGFLAYVIEGGKARERVLELGMRTQDGLVEVRSGLAPAESLVVRGAEALRDGAPVRTGATGKGGSSAGKVQARP